MTVTRTLAPAALAALIATAAAQPAQAQANEAMLARLKGYMAEQGSAIEWRQADSYAGTDGKQVTALLDVRVSNGAEQIYLPTIDLADVTQEGGGWRIGKLTVPSFTQKIEDSEIAIYDTSFHELILPPQGQGSSATRPYGSFTMRDFTFRVHQQDILKISDFHIDVDTPEAGKPVEFSGAVEAFHLKLDSLKDADTQAIVDTLGYRQLDGYVELGGTWDAAANRFAMDSYNLSIDKMGTLGLSFDVSGVSMALLSAAAQLQARVAANPDGDNTMAGLQAVSLLAPVTLHSARIGFDDDSLTQRAVGMLATQSGQDVDAVVAGAVRAVGDWAARFSDPALTEQARTAVETYLADPQSISITAEPPVPVSGVTIAFGALQGAQTLPQQLGLKIEANE